MSSGMPAAPRPNYSESLPFENLASGNLASDAAVPRLVIGFWAVPAADGHGRCDLYIVLIGAGSGTVAMAIWGQLSRGALELLVGIRSLRPGWGSPPLVPVVEGGSCVLHNIRVTAGSCYIVEAGSALPTRYIYVELHFEGNINSVALTFIIISVLHRQGRHVGRRRPGLRPKVRAGLKQPRPASAEECLERPPGHAGQSRPMQASPGQCRPIQAGLGQFRQLFHKRQYIYIRA